MNIGILGTGVVGSTLGARLAAGGHQVKMGSRTPDNPKAVEWAAATGPNASTGTFADAARFGEVVINCTAGSGTLEALRLAGTENFAGKLLIDVSNPLDFTKGFPPSLSVCNLDSLGEQIQEAFPDARVVKALNTMNCFIMANPALLPGDHNVFLSGNDADAKAQVSRYLQEWFGWRPQQIIDLGDITTSRGPEMLLPIWVRLYGALQNPNFNFQVVTAPPPQA